MKQNPIHGKLTAILPIGSESFTFRPAIKASKFKCNYKSVRCDSYFRLHLTVINFSDETCM
jgi:hypothetical protein